MAKSLVASTFAILALVVGSSASAQERLPAAPSVLVELPAIQDLSAALGVRSSTAFIFSRDIGIVNMPTDAGFLITRGASWVLTLTADQRSATDMQEKKNFGEWRKVKPERITPALLRDQFAQAWRNPAGKKIIDAILAGDRAAVIWRPGMDREVIVRMTDNTYYYIDHSSDRKRPMTAAQLKPIPLPRNTGS
jgi:hypothetical protein